MLLMMAVSLGACCSLVATRARCTAFSTILMSFGIRGSSGIRGPSRAGAQSCPDSVSLNSDSRSGVGVWATISIFALPAEYLRVVFVLYLEAVFAVVSAHPLMMVSGILSPCLD